MNETMNHLQKTIMRNWTGESKFQLAIASLFGASIILLSLSQIGYIPLNNYRVMDMSIVPALFAAMIGGYRVAVPVGIVWATMAFLMPESGMSIYGWTTVATVYVIFTVTTTYFYQFFRRVYKRSPYNVYRATIAATFCKFTVENLFAPSLLLEAPSNIAVYNFFINQALQQFAIEIGILILAMMLMIRHLRQVHLLNGVRKRGETKQ